VRFFANRYLPKGVFILDIALPLALKSFDQGNTLEIRLHPQLNPA